MSQSVPYLQVDHLTKSYGDLLLFEDICFGVAEGERIALIAQNGRGKSTLLNILAGDKDYEAGAVTFRRDLRVSYLPQEPQVDDAATVMQACFQTDSETVRVIARYEQKIRQDGEQVMDAEMEQLLHLMDFHQAWDYEVRVKQILTRLSIPDFSRPMGCLSGGERKRVALANALISEPELLILDEPTNHLDLPMTEWLEKYLVKSGITLLMVTHDRYFLDRVCTRILEIDDRRLYNYNGNYSYYLEKRQERIDASNAHLARANARFLYGCTGINLDILARGPLWEADLDYKHGTGHGIGHILNVHEGPNGFRWKPSPDRSEGSVLEEGMITSDEPGLYFEGKFGIRTESELLCRRGEKNEYGQFMYFENLTFVPIDLDAVDITKMNETERRWLNEYHAMVYETMAPRLREDEQAWLKDATRAI